MNTISFYALILVVLFMFVANFIYYPKWQNVGTEATLSWDVSGYYMYLPAIFIYKDLKKVGFKNNIHEKYNPASSMYQTFTHPSGNEVMKYSAGMAVMYSPFFALGHLGAKITGADQDGFSRPYQLAISIESLLVAILGLLLIRWALLQYFSDKITALTLISVGLCTNYLEYASISGAMSHNYLFTIYAAVIVLSIKYFRKPSWQKALSIGLLCGLAALTRPSEMIIIFIPILWNIVGVSNVPLRYGFLLNKWKHVLLLAIGAVLIGSMQLIYWKYVSGDWLVYSYEEQGFSWLRPHVIKGMFNTKAGWFVYSPIMLFSLIGYFFLKKKAAKVFWAVLVVGALGMYINFAWDEWTYGGSLGQRALIQLYTVLMFPMAAIYSKMEEYKIWKYLLYGIIGLCFYYNMWWMKQAHSAGYFIPDQVNTNFWTHTVGKWKFDREYYKLLDRSDWLAGNPVETKVLFSEDFENNAEVGCTTYGLNGEKSMCIDNGYQNSPIWTFTPSERPDWLRAKALIKAEQKEWNHWQMTQFIMKLKKDGKDIKDGYLRVQRIMDHGEQREVFFDLKVKDVDYDEIEVKFWNPGSHTRLVIDDLMVEGMWF